MADSENSRILTLTTRRNLLAAASASLASIAVMPSWKASAAGINNDAALIALWNKWQSAHQRRYELCVRQQALETQLLQTVGSFPIVKLKIPGEEKFVCAYTVKEIESALPGTAMAKARKRAINKLQSLRKAWTAEDERIGYSRAYNEEISAIDIEWALANTLWETPAHSLDGVTAKLHSLIQTEDPGAQISDAPWPLLRSLLADLHRMRACKLRHR